MLIMAHLGHQKTALKSHVFIWEQAITGAFKGGEHPHGGEFKLPRLRLEFPGAFKANGSDLRDSVDVYEWNALDVLTYACARMLSRLNNRAGSFNRIKMWIPPEFIFVSMEDYQI